MKFSYYPGCTLRNKAKDLDAYARASAKALGFELEELQDWQCCGGVYPLGTDEIASKLSSVRALDQAKQKGQDLVTLCSACHHVLKRVNDDMQNVEDIRTRANNYMKLDEPYAYTEISGSHPPVGKWVVEEGEVFVMGDNRYNSTDSRDIGPIDIDSILGKVVLRFYPFSSFGSVE